MMLQTKMHDLSARHLVLSLYSASEKRAGPIQLLILAGALFEIEASTIRVAVGRLVKEGVLVSIGRGVYALDASAEKLCESIRLWARADKMTKPWSGKWILIHTAHLGRTDKKQVRARERALRLYGFCEVMPGLWVRPDNLVLTDEALYDRLTSTGLESDAIMFESVANIVSAKLNLLELWSRDEIEEGYRACLNAMKQSRSRIPRLKSDEAARETFLVGQAVIREINLDPLLPEGLIDTTLRDKVIEEMRAYDDIGRRCWDSYFAAVT